VNTIAAVIAAAAVVALAGLWASSALTPGPASADPLSPHVSLGGEIDTCASCHRIHTGQDSNLLKDSVPQSTLCFTCHDGTGASSNIAAEYSDATVPANDPVTSSFYSHPATTVSTHTSSQVDEFAGVLNRHSECGDCHNPHQADSGAPVETPAGWTASGALVGITGVSGATPLTWLSPIGYEYELCLKCHSGYTQLLSYSKESYKKTDKAAEFDPAGASYHPVEAPGKNTTAGLNNSLAGGILWQFTTGSTIRCSNCHGNYRLVGSPPTPNSPAPQVRLAPHSSPYRGLLIANYRDRALKPRNEAYASTDFTLCFLCHSPAPFSDGSGNPRVDTNFRLHGIHLTGIATQGSGAASLDIDVAGGGQGNAICAECHFRVHGTAAAPWPGNQNYSRGVNFAPDVQPPLGGPGAPDWSLNDSTCSLTCHGAQHDLRDY
jgi:predicted CXXCH cytochrome family protein